jgi:hypothetical protein
MCVGGFDARGRAPRRVCRGPLLMTYVVPRFARTEAPCALPLPVSCLKRCWRRRESLPARDWGLDSPLAHLLLRTVSLHREQQ